MDEQELSCPKLASCKVPSLSLSWLAAVPVTRPSTAICLGTRSLSAPDFSHRHRIVANWVLTGRSPLPEVSNQQKSDLSTRDQQGHTQGS
jgi:hypothetical protein